jgi:ankyrin repeat protein
MPAEETAALLQAAFENACAVSDEEAQVALSNACAKGDEPLARLFLLRPGVDLNWFNKANRSAMVAACQKGHVNCVQLLLEHDASSQPLGTADLPLLAACAGGHPECAALLLVSGADVNRAGSRGATALHLASARGELPTVGLDRPFRDGDGASEGGGRTAPEGKGELAGTAQRLGHKTRAEWLLGQEGAVRVLLEARANVDARLDDGHSALMLACGRDRASIVRLLLDSRASVDAQRRDGVTALIIAVQEGHAKCVDVLIECGKAKVDVALSDGHCALLEACGRGDASIVRALLNAKASVSGTNHNGVAGLHFACGRGHDACATILIDRSANVNQGVAQQGGCTALTLACEGGHAGCARVLLESGANANATDSGGFTALAISCLYGHSDCAGVLLAHGAAVERAVGERGYTALIVACQEGHTGCVSVLLDARADMNAPTVENITPLIASSLGGHLSCVQLMLSRGASRTQPRTGRDISDCARSVGQHTVADWLHNTSGWSSPLHFVELPACLTAERALKLLRSGAEVSGGSLPTPLSLARSLLARLPSIEMLERRFPAAALVLAAAGRWSVETHRLFPKRARRWATELVRVGYLLAWQGAGPFEGRESALVDVWRGVIMGFAVTRESGRRGRVV